MDNRPGVAESNCHYDHVFRSADFLTVARYFLFSGHANNLRRCRQGVDFLQRLNP
jgi:hypothetical protein